MAKASSLADSLGKELECAVCLEQYKEPKVLPCLHSFCKKCLEGLLTKETKNVRMGRTAGRGAQARRKKVPVWIWKINCPTCRISVEIPQGEIDSLPVNFFLNNLLSVVALHEDSTHTSVGCDICVSGAPPVNRCTTCCSFLCECCSQAHLRARDTRSHGMVSVEEAKKMGSVAMAKPPLCKEHKGEVMKVFCATCDKVICRDCTVVEHRDHEYTFVEEAYSKEKERLLNILSETKTRIPMLEEALESVSEMKTRIQCHTEQTVQEATKCCDDLVDCVNTRRKKLVQLTEELRKVKLKGLQIQEEELETTLASVKNGVEFTEKSLKNSSKIDMLNMHKEMSSRLEGFNSAKWQLTPCTDDVVKLNVDMKQLMQAMKNFGRITDVETCAAMSTVTMDNGSEGVMCNTLRGEQITFTVTAKEQNGRKQRNGGDNFQAKICCSEDSSTEWLKVKDCKDGTYTFTYTPQQVGQYELSVKLSDCHVQGSPFRWKVEDLHMRYGASTVTMGNGTAGVMYSTLCGQPVEFTINTRKEQVNKKLSSCRDIFQVEICLCSSYLGASFANSSLSEERISVRDMGNGCYSFCYTPTAKGSYILSIKVDDIHLRGSPFKWYVEEWKLTWPHHLSFSWKSYLNLVDENMRAQYVQHISFLGSSALSAFGSKAFSRGKHSWKVRLLMGNTSEEFGLGVASRPDFLEEIRNGRPLPLEEKFKCRWIWSSESKCRYTTGPHVNDIQRSPSANFNFENNDVIELYLDCDNWSLMMYNQRTKKSNTWVGFDFRNSASYDQPISPVFQMCTNGDEVSLRL